MRKRNLHSNITTVESRYAQYQEQKKQAKRVRNWKALKRISLIAVVFGVLFTAMIHMGFARTTTVDEKLAEKRQYEAELENLRQERYNLEQEIKNLNDDEYILKLARSEYFFSRPGETIFIVPNSSAD